MAPAASLGKWTPRAITVATMPAAVNAVTGPSRGGGQSYRGGGCGSECGVGVEAFTGHHSPQSGRYLPLAH